MTQEGLAEAAGLSLKILLAALGLCGVVLAAASVLEGKKICL